MSVKDSDGQEGVNCTAQKEVEENPKQVPKNMKIKETKVSHVEAYSPEGGGEEFAICPHCDFQFFEGETECSNCGNSVDFKKMKFK